MQGWSQDWKMWLADLGTLLARIRFLSLWKAERVPKVPLEMSLSSTLSRVIRVHSKLNSLWAGVFKLMNLTHHWPYWEVQIWGKKLRAGDVTASPWSEKKAHLLYGTLRQRCSVFLYKSCTEPQMVSRSCDMCVVSIFVHWFVAQIPLLSRVCLANHATLIISVWGGKVPFY